MHILVIEDEPLIRQTLQDLLELNGHTVSVAADGKEGIARAVNRPDLILCDIGLPGMDGYDVIQAIQQLPQCKDLPFIFLTARANRSDQRHGMSLGADDYITKPFTEKDILDSISARVRRQRPLRERLEILLTQKSRQLSAEWSHELLTPLNGMLGGLALLEAEAENTEKSQLKEMMGLIRESAERQLKLSLKLIRYFELEQIREKTRVYPRQSCEAAEAIHSAVKKTDIPASRASDLLVKADECPLPIWENHLADAIAELVSNALRFSKPGDPVTITGSKRETNYQIEIVDRGPGMSASQRANVAAFTQFDRAIHQQEGLGLGLAIAMATASIIGGKLYLKEGAGGTGLRALMVLPLSPHQATL